MRMYSVNAALLFGGKDNFQYLRVKTLILFYLLKVEILPLQCFFASLLLMDYHNSSLLLAMHLFPCVQKIPTDGEGQLCPESHWGGNLTLGQEQLSRATCCCYQPAFHFFLGYLLQRPLSGGEEPVHAPGV